MAKNGDVFFKIGDADNLFTKLIKEVTGCPVTHCIIYMYGSYYESTIKRQGLKWYNGVIRDFSIKKGYTQAHFKGFLTIEQTQKMYEFLYHRIGVRYNWLLLLNMWWIYPLKGLWKKLQWSPYSKKMFGFICSQLVDSAYLDVGIDLVKDRKAAYTSPCDLYNSKKLTIVRGLTTKDGNG